MAFWYKIDAEDIENLEPKRRGIFTKKNGKVSAGKFETFLAGPGPSEKEIKAASKTFVCQLLYYLIFIVIGWLVAILLFQIGLIQIGVVVLPNVLIIIFFQLILVSISETLIFHVIIPMRLRAFFKGKISENGELLLTYLISQSIFSLFHGPAFGWEPFSLFVTFLWGLSFMAITDYYGASSTMGFHFGVNMVLSGILAGGIISGSLLTFLIEPVAIIIIYVSFTVLILKFIWSNKQSFRSRKVRRNIYGKAIREIC